MSIYGSNNLNNNIELNESEREVLENLIVAELAETLTSEEFNAFLESDECETLMEAGRISKKTIMRLNKVDDLERRTSMAAIDLAKQSNNIAFKEYQKAMKKARIAKEKMLRQFGSKGKKIAKKAQKEFLRMPSLKVSSKTLKKANKE